MRRLFNHSISLGWLLLVEVIVMLAVILSLSRLILPFANEFRAPLAQEVGRIIGHPVNIGLLEATWNGIKPVITLRQVSVLDDDGQSELAAFNQVYLKVSPWQSLQQGRLVPEKLVLKDSWLQFLRHEDGRLSILGVDARNSDQQTVRPLEVKGPASFYLENVRTNLRDDITGNQHSVLLDFARVAVDRDALSLDANVTLSDDSDESLHVVLRSQGQWTSPMSANSQFYLEGQQLDTSILREWADPEWPQLVRGKLNTQLWGDWDPDQGLALSGRVLVDDAELIAANRKELVWPFTSVSSYFHFSAHEQQWQLDTENMQVGTVAGSWPVSGFSLAQSGDPAAPHWSLKGDFLDIGDMVDAAAIASSGKSAVINSLIDSGLDASLRDFAFEISMRDTKPQLHVARGAVTEAGWKAAGKRPGMSNVTLGFDFEEGSGQAQLRAEDAVFEYSRVFEKPIDVALLQAALSLELSDAGLTVTADELRLKNADIDARGTAIFSLDQAQRRLDLEVQAPSVNAARVRDYVPYGILKRDQTQSWLRDAFVGGVASNVRFNFNGQLKKDAIKTGDAKIRAEFDVRDGQLHYGNGWPDAQGLSGHVTFDHTRMTARVDQGQLLDAKFESGTVGIPDLFKTRVDIRAKARAPLPSVFRFLRETPLLQQQDALLARVDSSGEVDLNLDLKIPLSHKFASRRPLINLDARFDHNRVTLRDALTLDNVRGNLRMEDMKFASESLKADFRGSEVMGAVKTAADGSTLIDVGGVFEPARLLPQLAPQLDAFSAGSSYFHGQVRLAPGSADGGQPLSLHATSKLKNTAITLPAPLAKPVGQEQKLVVDYRFGQQPELALRLGELLSFEARFDADDRFRLLHGALGLGTAPVAQPAAGLRVAGSWPQLPVEPWQQAITRLIGMGKGGAPLQFDTLQARFGSMDVAGMQLLQPRVSAVQDPAYWQVNLEAQQLAGTVSLPHANPDAPIIMRLSRLQLAESADANASHSAASTVPDYPSLDLQAELFRLGERELGRLELQTTRTGHGLSIDHLRLVGSSYQFTASGDWQRAAQFSNVQFLAKGEDIGQALSETGFGGNLGSGKGELSGELSWNGVPTSIDWPSLGGRVSLDVENGDFREVEPGLGRLVGLLNIDSLPRRLAFDFRDFSEIGFHYDRMKGSGRLDHGLLSTNDLQINSPSALLEISGDTSLVTRHHQLQLAVTPKLKSTVPLAASVIAGPQTGAVVYLVDKLAESVGVDFNRTATMRYAVTGTWKEPKLKSLSSLATER